jgi:hypothetical protein
METETIKMMHFTLGENAGLLLMQIAQENLLYYNNPRKAIEALTQSLIGCPLELAIDLLHGSKVLLVIDDNGEQYFNVVDREEGVHDHFPRLDCVEFARRNTKELADHGESLATALRYMLNRMRKGSISKEFSYNSIIKFIGGDTADIFEEINNDSEVSELATLIRISKAYVEKEWQ